MGMDSFFCEDDVEVAENFSITANTTPSHYASTSYMCCGFHAFVLVGGCKPDLLAIPRSGAFEARKAVDRRNQGSQWGDFERIES